MNVLDPFEVFEIEVYPLPEYQRVNSNHPDFKEAKKHLDALEYYVHQKAIAESKFKAILNEKDPDPPKVSVALPKPVQGAVVSAEAIKLRSHPDVRIANAVPNYSQTYYKSYPNATFRSTAVSDECF